jgi:hypothetical protein
MARYDPIKAGDPQAVAKLRERIQSLSSLITRHRAEGKMLADPRLTAEEKRNRLVKDFGHYEPHADDVARTLGIVARNWRREEIRSYTNIVRRMRDRVSALEKEKARPTSTVRFDGGWMEDHAKHRRVKIFYDVEPLAATVADLKAFGFRENKARFYWYRQRGDRARWAASKVTGVAWPEISASGVPAVSASETASQAPRASV